MNTQSVAGTGSPDLVPAAHLEGITKRYGAVVACDGVDLALHRGRIHGILGENGAGKSTLMKVLIGLVLPESGTVTIDGEPCLIADPLDAARRGIGMVHQHFSLIEPLTVWENVALGDIGRLEPGAVRARVAEISEHYGLEVDPDAVIADLPAGLRQRVEIVKCLRRDPDILILDEPTSVLTPAESEQLFDSLRLVIEEENRAVALVSHKLDEILQATDEVTIMRHGRVVEHLLTSAADAPSLAAAMVGRPVSLRSERVALGLIDTDLEGTELPDIDMGEAETALSLRDVTVRARAGHMLLDGISLELRAGEILGVAGVEGNGQRPLADLLSSLLDTESGSIEVGGIPVRSGNAGAMAAAGVGVIPEDRHDSGVVLDMTVAENLFLIDPRKVATRGLIDIGEMNDRAADLIREFDISCSGPDAPLWSLSGGNQQRLILARELSHRPMVLAAAQPTHGLDVGAIEYMTDRLRRAADEGVGLLLISSELEEILDLSHRIVVLFRGRIIGEMNRADADFERIGLLMGGHAA